MGEFFDTDDFGDVFASQGIVHMGERKGDEYAHAGVVGVPAAREEDPSFRDIDAGGKVFEMVVAGVGRADTNGTSHLGTPAGAFNGIFGFWRDCHKLNTARLKALRSLLRGSAIESFRP